jgi:hypothetical protein
MEGLIHLKKLILEKKSRIFNIYEITNGEEFKKDFDLVRQIRRHQFQFHQILQKDLKTRIKFIYFFCSYFASSAEVNHNCI